MRSIGMVILGVVVMGASALGEVRYHVTDLGTLGNGTWAWAVNDSGHVVGYSTFDPATPGKFNHAFLWTAEGGIQDLGDFGGGHSSAFDINNHGVVVGSADNRAFKWTATEQMQELITFKSQSSARGINDRNEIVGIQYQDGMLRACYWDSSGEPTGYLFQSESSVYQSHAVAVNNSGLVTGKSPVGDEPTTHHAFLWSEDDGPRDLGDFGMVGTTPRDINDHGLVVGGCHTSPTTAATFLWTEDGGVQFPIDGVESSIAYGVNNRGQVVGWIRHLDGQERAYLLEQGQVKDLTDLVPGLDWTLELASDINEYGQIVGWGRAVPDSPPLRGFFLTHADANLDGAVDDNDLSLVLAHWGQRTGFPHGNLNSDARVDDDDLSVLLSTWTGPLAVPVPEPATMSLLVVGGVAILCKRRSPGGPRAHGRAG